MGGPQENRTTRLAQWLAGTVPTCSLTLGWIRTMAAMPLAWASAAVLVALAPASAIVTSRGSLVLRDLDAEQTSKDLTWLGSVAAILAVLSWLPRAAGLVGIPGRGRSWSEAAVLFVGAGALGACLTQASTFLHTWTATGNGLLEHAAIVLQVGGLASLVASIPVSRRAPAWTFLGVIACAEVVPDGILGRALIAVTASNPSDASRWLVVAGLWMASVPVMTGAGKRTAAVNIRTAGD